MSTDKIKVHIWKNDYNRYEWYMIYDDVYIEYEVKTLRCLKSIPACKRDYRRHFGNKFDVDWVLKG